ncbi:unnamed protein product [Nyctereutes procyonoides]|uniref:(raccoon dog) hypothetical protein n=1 Tax=Nyctereutes procyonoides TaxID=34880 RepID=A0A811XQA4_NYCPR|nr:unnamed protein product [Nyctereutes procyonoides]
MLHLPGAAGETGRWCALGGLERPRDPTSAGERARRPSPSLRHGGFRGWVSGRAVGGAARPPGTGAPPRGSPPPRGWAPGGGRARRRSAPSAPGFGEGCCRGAVTLGGWAPHPSQEGGRRGPPEPPSPPAFPAVRCHRHSGNAPAAAGRLVAGRGRSPVDPTPPTPPHPPEPPSAEGAAGGRAGWGEPRGRRGSQGAGAARRGGRRDAGAGAQQEGRRAGWTSSWRGGRHDRRLATPSPAAPRATTRPHASFSSRATSLPQTRPSAPVDLDATHRGFGGATAHRGSDPGGGAKACRGARRRGDPRAAAGARSPVARPHTRAPRPRREPPRQGEGRGSPAGRGEGEGRGGAAPPPRGPEEASFHFVLDWTSCHRPPGYRSWSGPLGTGRAHTADHREHEDPASRCRPSPTPGNELAPWPKETEKDSGLWAAGQAQGSQDAPPQAPGNTGPFHSVSPCSAVCRPRGTGTRPDPFSCEAPTLHGV